MQPSQPTTTFITALQTNQSNLHELLGILMYLLNNNNLAFQFVSRDISQKTESSNMFLQIVLAHFTTVKHRHTHRVVNDGSMYIHDCNSKIP